MPLETSKRVVNDLGDFPGNMTGMPVEAFSRAVDIIGSSHSYPDDGIHMEPWFTKSFRR